MNLDHKDPLVHLVNGAHLDHLVKKEKWASQDPQGRTAPRAGPADRERGVRRVRLDPRDPLPSKVSPVTLGSEVRTDPKAPLDPEASPDRKESKVTTDFRVNQDLRDPKARVDFRE